MSDTQPRIQTCQPIISQMRRFLKKLPRNGEKRSQSRENLHKAIYVNFHIKKLLLPTKVFLSGVLYFELPKNFVICFKETFASLLVDTTKASSHRSRRSRQTSFRFRAANFVIFPDFLRSSVLSCSAARLAIYY